MSIGAVKSKLCSHTGSNPSAMELELKNPSGILLAVLQDDDRKLGFYSPKNGFILHVVDKDPLSASANGWLEDTSKVTKYVMSDEDYEKRENTYRKYKQEKLQEDPTWTLEKEIAKRRGVEYTPGPPAKGKVDDDEHMADVAQTITLGSRCRVISAEGEKRGVVRYVGKCSVLPKGWWIGVEYDEPVGKNDGSVNNLRCFDCSQGYGAFVRPNLVEIGDYPPFDIDFGEDDEI